MKSSTFESKSIRSRNSRLSHLWSSAEPRQIDPAVLNNYLGSSHQKFGVWNGPYSSYNNYIKCKIEIGFKFLSNNVVNVLKNFQQHCASAKRCSSPTFIKGCLDKVLKYNLDSKYYWPWWPCLPAFITNKESQERKCLLWNKENERRTQKNETKSDG